MKARLLAFAAALSLAACFNATSFASHNVEVRVHRALPASGVASVRIENVAGSITVEGWNRPDVDVSALEYGADQSSIDRTHVDVNRNGDEIAIETRYDQSGGLFGNRSGAEVDYTIRVPASTSIWLKNVSGPTMLSSLSGNVEAEEVSGQLDASLGRLAATRSVHLSAVSGRITVRITRTSDAWVDASTITGNVTFFFPADIHRGVIGGEGRGEIGKGHASLSLHTVSGSIAVEPE